MATKLSERLEELAAFVEHAHAVESIEETLGHLQMEIAEAMTLSQASAQQCTILLFQSTDPPSLLRFLSTSAAYTNDGRKREISAARGGVLELLSSFLKTYGAHRALSKQHVIDLYTACQQTARADPFNRVKAHALNVVVSTLKYANKHTIGEDIEPRAYLEKLFYDIKFSKATQTAKGQMLEVIGYLVEQFATEVEENVLTLLSWIEMELEKQFLSNSPEMMMVNGLLFALARLLECDAERYKRDEALRKKIYSYLMTIFATTASGNLSRYEVTNSAETFLAKHAQIFHREIGPNGCAWFSYMKFCCLSESKAVKEHAFVCSNAILQVLNAYLAEAKDDSRNKCLNKILKEVLPVVSDASVGTSTMTFAVQCLGWLASSIFMYLGSKGYAKIEGKLKAFGESLLALDAKATAWKWSLFSQFVQCIGQFVQQRHDVVFNEGYVKFLGDILCHLMTSYPQCLWKSKVVVHKSIATLFVAVSNWTVIDPLVDRFVHHTLLLSISNVTGSDQAVIYHPDTGELVTNLLYDYEGFWLALLRCRSEIVVGMTRATIATGSDNVQMIQFKNSERALQAIILDSTIKHVLGIIKQLDLSYQFDLETTNNGKDATGYSPVVPRDHSIMLNLTEFVERVLGQMPSSLLCPWIPLIMYQIFASTSDLPLVSCFYRIGTVVAKAMLDVEYFESPSTIDTTGQTQFRDDFTHFVQRVSAYARFYQDELLLKCAEFVLTAPIGLEDSHTTVGILKSILKLGKSFLPAAVVAITALERWQKQRPNEQNDVISEIIPFLSAYLDEEEPGEKDLFLVKSNRNSMINPASDEASDLTQVQRRLLLLLGRCDGKTSLLMSEPPSLINANGIMGSIFSPYFRLELQLSEVPLSLAMDPILFHLGSLAIQSSIRRVKASACEGYHALVCYLYGKTMTHPHSAGKKTKFYDLWRRVFAQVVQLATDPEKICRSLFEPLLFQLLRWLAANSNTFPFEYASLLDELTSSLSDSETAVRTLSARCIAVQLSLAFESRTAQMKANDIFERVFSLCRHPGAVQRSGAAVSISYFLRSVSEEDGDLLTQFAIPCLKNLLYALRLCDNDTQNKNGEANISQDVISKAIMKIERGICRFPHLFLIESTTTDSDSILHQTTAWLFQQSGAREMLFRRLCRRLFMSFCALISKSIAEWMQNYELVHGSESIVAVLVPMSALVHTNVTVEWMEQLSVSMESYVWCVEMLGDKTRGIVEIREPYLKKESMKRKHTAEMSDSEVHSRQPTLSWAISTFLKCDGIWENTSKRSLWIGAYISVLDSLCSFVKSLMSNCNMMLGDVIDLDNQSLRTTVIEKLLGALLHWADAQLHDTNSLRAIEEFCSYVTLHSPHWAHQMQVAIDTIFLNLQQCLTEVTSSETLVTHSDTITSISHFGSKVLCAEIVKSPAAEKYAEIFALVASKVIEFGHGSPHDRLVVVAALKGAAACGWKITDIFFKFADRQVYASVYSDVIHMMPTLTVWKRCASELVALSLENDFVVNVLVDILREVACCKIYVPKSADWDAFTYTLAVNVKHFIKKLKAVIEDTQRALSIMQVLRYFLELGQKCSATYIEALRIEPIPSVQNAVTILLKQRGCSYLVKADILHILGTLGPNSILVSNAQQPSEMTLEALVAFVYDEFPIVSADVSRGSKEFDIYHMLFTELLRVIEQSKSIAFLKVIYPSLKEAKNHLFGVEIKQMLARFSILLGSGVQSGSVASGEMVRYQMAKLLNVLLDSSVDVAIRKALLEDVFTPLIECQTGEPLLRFYLMESPTKSLNIISLLATLISTSVESISAGCQIGIFVAFTLVEIMYRLVDPEIIRIDINSAFLGHKNGKGREFTMLVCKCASKVVTKTFGDVDDFVRLACCAAYNCLLTAVSQTQKQEKIYDQILFQPTLWSNILDPSREYELRAETDTFATVPLSSLSAISLQSRRDVDLLENARSKNSKTAALQFFTRSSLSMDADLLTATETESLNINQAAPSYQNIEIELCKLNQHPCMIPLLRVLVQMKTDFGSSWTENSMPGWMKNIYNVIVDPSAGLNVRLFLAKVVLDVPFVFSTYSSAWLRAVIDALLDVSAAQTTPEFSYILRDCCNLVLGQWKDVPVSLLDITASRFVNALIKLCPDRNVMIRNSNVLLVTELIALWKDSINIDARELIAYMVSNDEIDTKIKSAKQFVALQIVSTMLTAGLNSEFQADEVGQTIEDGILLSMTIKTTSLYTLAAEVGGLYLRTMNQLIDDDFISKLRNLIVDSYNKEDFGRFLAILRNASIHQADIVNSIMLQRLSFVLPKALSVDAWALLAADSISNACGNNSVVKDIFTHVQSVLGRFVAHRHSEVQLSTLRAITRLLDHLTVSELNRLVANTSEGGIDVLKYYNGHTLSECRGLLFAMAKKLYNKDVSDQTKLKVRVPLIRGLCDPDESLRNEAYDFWSKSASIVNSCFDRLLSIVGPLYSSELDEMWILYATNLLIGLSKGNNNFKRPLFPSSLGGGEYTETQIDACWEAKAHSMAPLFSVEANTPNTSLQLTQQTGNSTYNATSQADGFLGTTMQTQLFPFALASGRSNSSFSQSVVDSNSVNLQSRRNRFSKRHTPADNSALTDRSSNDKKASRRFFQDQFAVLKKKEKAQVIRERKQRQGHVVMKRTYRVGEFPDIQITHQDIVDPIMALCEISIETSSLLFGVLFSSIVETTEFEKSGISNELTKRLEETLTLSKTSSVYVGCIVSAYFASIIRNPRLCDILPLRPQTIGDAGLASGKLHVSELVLEELLINRNQSETAALSLKSNESLTECWDRLYKLLGTMHKHNFLIALSMACSTTTESKQALQAQLSGDLPLAIATFKKAESILQLQMEQFDDGNFVALENDAMRCRWQRFNCLETLNNWDALKAEISDATNRDIDFLWKQRPPYLEQGVGHYLHSCLGLLEADESGDILTSLQHLIGDAVRDSAKVELIQSRFSVELCLAYLSSSDKNQARVCAESFYTNFLKMWRQISPMASTSRMQLLQSLSSIVKIDDILFHHGLDYSNTYKIECPDLIGYVNKWKYLPPFAGEMGMLLWSQHTMVQNTIADFMLNYAKDQGLLSDGIRLAVLGRKSSALLQYANAAISCNILSLASKMLKKYRELCNHHHLPKLSVQMVEVFVSHVLKLVDRQEHQSNNSSSTKLIARYYETATKLFDNKEMMQMMETAVASDKVAMGFLEAKTFASAAAFYAFNDFDDNLKKEYFSRSLDMFKVSGQGMGAVSSEETRNNAPFTLLRCRLTFIEFLNDLLFKRQLEKLAKLADRKVLIKLLAENVLRGMAAGDRECAHYFPQLCDVISPHPDIVAEFKQCVLTDVPVWTCLQWSAQLMALLNESIGVTIVAILEKMAEKYPVALFYDFMVTCKSSQDKFKVNLHRLEVLLVNPVMEKFVAALNLIHHPELRLKERLREISKLIDHHRTLDARKKVELLWKDCFSPDRPLLGAKIGRYNRDWSRKVKRDVEKILGKDGSKMTAKSVSSAREWIINHFDIIPGRHGITKDMKAHLGDFAEWLVEFDPSNYHLELPGQYTSYWGPPDPSTHIRILTFDSMLGVLASKQLPKRLTVHCSDEKDYTFLVKGGEDLRLDQRIEQLFGVMNQIFEADPRCRDQNLALVTYNVIPMTQEIGLLEWIDGTSTLKGVIETQLQIDERCINLNSNPRQKLELFNTTAAKAYESFLLKQPGASYSAKVISPLAKDVIDNFTRVQAMIPADLLRRQLLGLGSTFEVFLKVRDNFLKSLAVFSACSYVLGIGDRHLDNILLDLGSGRVIGIDFGVSFGAGASVLPVPELIPFRYTRQMGFVFQPYDGANLLAQEMQAIFDALRSKRQVVESVMNVFLHEPLLDWQQAIKTHETALFEEADGEGILYDRDVEMEDAEELAPACESRTSKTSTAEGNLTFAWLPDVKISIARKKLEGVSPALLLKKELAQNLQLKQHLSKFHTLIDAASTGEVGADDAVALSPLAQAQQLLAIATAPDLLGRTFQGWMPWL